MPFRYFFVPRGPVEQGLSVIKIGGSVITNKSKRFTLNREKLGEISKILSRLYKEGWKLIVVHGGGSFGHPVAALYHLDEGGLEGRKLFGFAETRYWMEVLNLRVVRALLDAGVPASSLQTSAIAISDGGKISKLEFDFLEKYIVHGIVPVLYGDVVIDESLGASILSGDDLAVEVAVKFKADSLVFVMGSGGIYDSPPGRPGSKLLTEITPDTEIGIGATRGIDVTDGVRRKIQCAFRAAKEGIRVSIGGVRSLYQMVKGVEGRYTRVRVR